MAEVILPGTYITVRDEGLITAGGVVSGYIGIVGTASKGPINEVKILGSFTEAREIFGEADPWQGGGKNELTLIRALELIYNNGGRTVYAVRTAPGAGAAAPKAATYQVKDEGGKTVATLSARSPGKWGEEINIKISDTDNKQKQVEISHQATKETYLGSNTGELVQAINNSSRLVSAAAADRAAEKAVPTNTKNGGDNLGGGTNGETATVEDYENSLALLENEIINIVVLAGQDVAVNGMGAALQGHLNRTAQIKRERIGLIGSNGTGDIGQIADHPLDSDRLIYTAPGIRATVIDPNTRVASQVSLPGGYLAAAVAGLISSLPVQTSPTNKTLTIEGLSSEFSSSQLEKLVQSRVLAVEKRNGFRVVKGITTATNSAWHQITTRRIVDYAIYGVRSACDPYIGKLNNVRVRGAMKATLDAFLTRMVDSEALVGYQLEVSATRAQEIAGQAIVTMTIQPTFSIDFIMVTMYLG
jgi:hypothetical protein